MDSLLQNLSVDVIIDWLGYISLFCVICLIVVLLGKGEKIKQQRQSLEKLQKSFDQLDEQAKLIVKTDLELNKTQEELDKKVTGLYALQSISHLVSTTLDENEIFARISQNLVASLGFEKALILMFDKEHKNVWKTTLGFSQEQLNMFLILLEKDPILKQAAKEGKTINSSHVSIKEIEQLSQTIDVAFFIISPILTQDGVIGIMLVGNSSMAPALTEGDQEIVSILSTQLGQSIENARLFEQVYNSHQDLEKKVKIRTKELAEALEQVKKISKAKSQFVSAVSHELRTPLTSIKGYAAILMAGTIGEIPDKIKERLEKINKHSDSLVQLINNLLDISRIESGRVAMKLEECDLKEMVLSVADMLVPQTKEKKIKLVANVPENLSKISADTSQIERVFINLLSNAIKFTPENGTITVDIKEIPGEAIEASVTDTGVGLAEDDLANVFEEFYRVDNAINQTVKGTGLGLPLVKYIVEAHQGKIWVKSTPNEKTTFTFTLPKKQQG